MTKNIKPIVFYTVLFFFILAAGTLAAGYDFDLWARLIAGMSVVQSGHVLKHDFLSYTPTHLWFDHEWGSGAVFYFFLHSFGAAGILILQTILVFSIFFIMTKIIKLRGLKTTTAYNLIFYFFTFIAMAPILNQPIRSQLFTFLFFTLFLYILELARKDKNRALFALAPIMIIWNNLHGGCISGIGLILLYIVGEFFNRKPVKKYIYALISTVIVLPINPWGFDYIKFLISANTMKRPEVIEWWGLFSKYHMLGYIKFKLFAAVLILTETIFVIKQSASKSFNFDKTKFLVLAVMLFLAIEHVKLIPFFTIAATCFLYDDFYNTINFITSKFNNKITMAKDILIYVIALMFITANLKTKAFNPILNWDKYPIRAIEFMKENNIKGDLLINFGLGSYASYKLYPQNKIFMDGRYEEVYYNNMVPMLKKFYLENKGWDEVLKKYPPDVMVIENYYPVYKRLKTTKEWKLVFEDRAFGVFVKSKDAKKEYKIPPTNLDYYKKSLFDTNINFVLKSK